MLNLISTQKISWLAICIALLVAGCPQPQASFAPVSGRVRLDGHPVQGAKVLFVPLEYRDANDNKLPYAYAITDENGLYTLQSDGSQRGVVVGRHRVFISTLQRPAKNVDSSQSANSSPENPAAPKTSGQPSEKSTKKNSPAATKQAERPEIIPSRYNTQSELVREVKRGTGNQFNFDLINR